MGVSMRIQFRDRQDGVWFEYKDTAGQHTIPVGKHEGKINLTGLYLYGMYRNAIYDSYKKKEDLAEDIKSHPPVFTEKTGSFFEGSRLHSSPLYHYAVSGSVSSINEWIKSDDRMKCYFAYKNIDGVNKIIGFVHFIEKMVDGRSAIYISQAGVMNQSTGVGRRLMECVLSHYPAGTHFYIVTRVFNHEAKLLYSNRLGFTPIDEDVIEKLGCDQRYCGFEHTTIDSEVQSIQDRKIDFVEEQNTTQPFQQVV